MIDNYKNSRQTDGNIEIVNLKRAIEELENINLHTIEERDELFRVSHELQTELHEYRNNKYHGNDHNNAQL